MRWYNILWLHILSVFCDASFPCYCCLCADLACAYFSCMLCIICIFFGNLFVFFLVARYLNVFHIFVSKFLIAFSLSIIRMLINCFGSFLLHSQILCLRYLFFPACVCVCVCFYLHFKFLCTEGLMMVQED